VTPAWLADTVWREPLWVWLALYPWLLLLLRGAIDRVRSHVDYADRDLLPWAAARTRRSPRPGQLLRFTALALSWGLFAIAMAGPRTPAATVGIQRDRLPQLVIVLDLSRSMTARDVIPSRLERARLELQDLLQRAQSLRVGLVVYAARPHLVAPPTADLALLRHYLGVLRADLTPTEGSDPAAALRFAAGLFGPQSAARAILLVSDGELPDPAAAREQELLDTAAVLQRQGISLYTLGVGTTAGATLLAPQGGWLRHEGSNTVSRLQETRLRTVATRGNGSYAVVSDTDAEWRELYDHGIARLTTARDNATDDGTTVWDEHYPLPLALAAILLLLGHWRPRRLQATAPLPVLCLAAVLATLLPAAPSGAADEDWGARAHQAWNDGAYVEARRLYARVPGYTGRMGEGASAYRAGQYRDAIGPFTEAILAANDDRQRADALFNLANTHYRLEDYATAIDYYRDVLRYRPADAATSVNLDYAQALYQQQLRRGDGPGSTRPGRGPRTARLAEGTDITRGNVTLDDESANPTPPPLPDGQSPLTTDDLINRGIRVARPADRRLAEQHDDLWVYSATTPERIELEAASLDVDESLLWKRIFESEEGFLAPQEEAHELPGVMPW